jgi:transcriptional regulator with XRE-family HTH domain
MAVNTAMNLSDQQFLRRLGTRIQKQRIALGLSQLELGRKCELHRTFVGSVERGERNISVLNLRLIAGALRVGLADLLHHAEEQRATSRD